MHSSHSQVTLEAVQQDTGVQATSSSDSCSHRCIRYCQQLLFSYGLLVERQWKLILFVTFLMFGLCTFGLKDIRLETRVKNLWFSDSAQEAEEERSRLLQNSESLYSLAPLSVMQLLPDSSLTRSQLMAHLQLLQRAVSMQVSVPQLGLAHDAKISLDQLCHQHKMDSTALPGSLIGSLIDSILPCQIASPLDCFWEGSKLLKPNKSFRLKLNIMDWLSSNQPRGRKYKWTNLDPMALLRRLEQRQGELAEPLRQLFDSAGLRHGYVRRPCLDPSDPDCPSAGANATAVLDALQGGCYGFAENLLHYPLRDLVGGRRFDRSGRLAGAKALMTSIVLKGPSLLLETYKGNQPWADWSFGRVLRLQRSWLQQLQRLVDEENARHGRTVFAIFHQNSTDEALEQATRMPHSAEWAILIGGCVLYLLALLFDWRSMLHSRLTVGLLAAPLLLLSATASLGLSCWLRLPADMLAVQILPFVQFGIAGYCCLNLANSCSFLSRSAASPELPKQAVAQAVQQEGGPILSFLLVSLAGSMSQLASPLAAVRLLAQHSCLAWPQLFVFCVAGCPAVLAADCARRRRLGADVLCCRLGDESALAPPKQLGGRLGQRLLRPCLRRRSLRAACLAAILLSSAAGCFCAARLVAEASFDPLHLIPKGTMQHLYLTSHRSLFSTSMLDLQFGELDYPRSQMSIRRFYSTLKRLPYVCNDNVLWLDAFRDWLLMLQRKFAAYRRGARRNSSEVSYSSIRNASFDIRLAANLLVQTGNIDLQEVSQLRTGWLVKESSGEINPEMFYIYLKSWYSRAHQSLAKANVVLLPRPDVQIMGRIPYGVEQTAPLRHTISRLQLCGLNSSRRSIEARRSILDVSRRFRRQGVRHTLTGTLMHAYSPEWLHPAKMAGTAALLLVACCTAALLLFCRLLSALVCICLCVVNLLQLAIVLYAAGVQLNVMTLTSVSLALPLVYLINASVVLHNGLSAQTARQQQQQQQQQQNFYAEIALEPPAAADAGAGLADKQDDGSDSQSGCCVRCLQACPLALAALAAAFVPGVPLLSLSVGAVAVGAVACSAATACCLAPGALRLLPLPPHPLAACRPRRRRTSRSRQSPSSVEEAAAAAAVLALQQLRPVVGVGRQRSLETISEESNDPSPAATPAESTVTARLPYQHHQQVVSATLHLRLQPDTHGPPPVRL